MMVRESRGSPSETGTRAKRQGLSKPSEQFDLSGQRVTDQEVAAEGKAQFHILSRYFAF